MNSSISNVQWFRQSAPYIKAHRGKTFVIVCNSDVLSVQAGETLAYDVALLISLGIRVVIVFDAVEVEVKLQPLSAKDFEQYCHNIHKQLFKLQALLSMGLANSPMVGAKLRVTTGNFIVSQPLGVVDGIDYGCLGQVRSIDKGLLEHQLAADNVVLVPPLGISPTGAQHYVPAMQLAPIVAGEINAEKMLCLSSIKQSADIPSQLSLQEARELMVEKKTKVALRLWLNIATDAIEQGVSRVHILESTQPDSLLSELFTSIGAGLLVTKEHYPLFRDACLSDVGGIMALTRPLEQKGVLVTRTQDYLEQAIDDFIVIEFDGLILGCAALNCFSKQHVAELACLVVDSNYQKQDWGAKLLSEIEVRARKNNIQQLIVLTTQAEDWFKQHGFGEAKLDDLPVERQAFYNEQRQSKVLIKPLNANIE